MASKPENLLNLAKELRWKIGDNFHDKLTEGIYTDASEIAAKAVSDGSASARSSFDVRMLVLFRCRSVKGPGPRFAVPGIRPAKAGYVTVPPVKCRAKTGPVRVSRKGFFVQSTT